MEIKCHLGFKMSQETPTLWQPIVPQSLVSFSLLGHFIQPCAVCHTPPPLHSHSAVQPQPLSTGSSLLFCPTNREGEDLLAPVLLWGSWMAQELPPPLTNQSGYLSLFLVLMGVGFGGQEERRWDWGPQCVWSICSYREMLGGQPASSNPSYHQHGFNRFTCSFILAVFYFTQSLSFHYLLLILRISQCNMTG